MQTAGLAMAKGVAFSVYGESLIIMVQNFLIIWLMWGYNKSIGTFEKMVVFLFFCAYGYVLFYKPELLTADHLMIISSSSTMLGIVGKVP